LVSMIPTIFVYNANGQMVAEYTTLAPTSSQINYLNADKLGTPGSVPVATVASLRATTMNLSAKKRMGVAETL
jgi:hypothetical protein